MVEISGLPFGLMGEMLEGGGNPWRGMLYGMTNRFPYQEKSPRPIWKLRDEFGFDGVRMLGFWDEAAPVSADRDDVKCTTYVSADGKRMLACFANFAGEDVEFVPQGLPIGGRMRMAAIDGLQQEAEYAGGAIPLAAQGGCVIWVNIN